jgi:hypothetical protein
MEEFLREETGGTIELPGELKNGKEEKKEGQASS